MERIARIVHDLGLEDLAQERLAAAAAALGPVVERDGVRLYCHSLRVLDGVMHFIATVDGNKSLYLASEKPFETAFDGMGTRIGGMSIFAAALSPQNAGPLHAAFPFTAPVSLRGRRTTIGCGDRLGCATPGHIRAVSQFDVSPVLAQQSIRELTLTSRTFAGVVADASFLVFQEGFEQGYGADGDHLKTIADIDRALDAKMPMITLDLTEEMSPAPASWSPSKIDGEFGQLDTAVTRHVLDTYADRSFTVAGATVRIDRTEAERCALMYWRALEFSRDVDRHLQARRGDLYDLEVSIDETTAPTLPSHHLFIASELRRREVAVSSLAPRFIGEFQKGIDYIGDTAELERQLAAHCAIAQAFGNYKISVHSGSDKFSAYPAIGRCTGMRVHLKTAGTSWLEAVRVVSRANPQLFRSMLARAFAAFDDASKLYHVTTDLAAIPDARAATDADLARYLDARDSRQLLHITYGGLLGDTAIRGPFFRTLAEHEEEHYAAVERHMEKHLRLLGAPPAQG